MQLSVLGGIHSAGGTLCYGRMSSRSSNVVEAGRRAGARYVQLRFLRRIEQPDDPGFDVLMILALMLTSRRPFDGKAVSSRIILGGFGDLEPL
jgi:hypothetical protein